MGSIINGRRLLAALLVTAAVAGAVEPVVASHDGGPELEELDVAPRETEAVLQVTIDEWDHAADSELYFVYWEKGTSNFQESQRVTPEERKVNGITVDGLSRGTTYHFQAIIEWDGGTYATGQSTFTTEGTASDDDGSGLLGPVLDKLNELVNILGGLGETLKDAFIGAIFDVFETLAQAIIDFLTHLIVSYPQVHPNPDVADVHEKVYLASLALSGIAFAATGLLYITGPVFGIRYDQLRMLIPRIIVALVFGAVAPMLLQYAVDLAEALTLAFKPSDPNLASAIRLSMGLVLVAVLDAILLLIVALIFVLRDIYILFAAAAAPLIALMWAMPYTRQYASSLIGVFWGFLLIGPLDMIVFSLALSLLETGSLGEAPDWIYGMGMLVMMAIVPYLVLSAGQSMAGVALGVMTGAVGGMKNTSSYVRETRRRTDEGMHDESPVGRQRTSGYMAEYTGRNRYNKDVILDDTD